MTSEHHGGFGGYHPTPLQVATFVLNEAPRGWAAPCPLLLPLRPAAAVAEATKAMLREYDLVGRIGGEEFAFVLTCTPMQAVEIAERVRKIGAQTLKSIGQISKNQRVLDNDADYVEPSDMLAELREDNATLAANMREAHELCDKHRDIATASLIEVWIDETERRAWFLHASLARPDSGGR